MRLIIVNMQLVDVIPTIAIAKYSIRKLMSFNQNVSLYQCASSYVRTYIHTQTLKLLQYLNT